MLAYAKQAKDMELIWIATEIKIRAERKCGELTQELPKIQGKRTSPHDGEKSKAQILQESFISLFRPNRLVRVTPSNWFVLDNFAVANIENIFATDHP